MNFHAWNERFNALNTRERVLVTVTLFALLAAVLVVGVIEPEMKQQSSSRQQLSLLKTSVEAQRSAAKLLENALQKDPSAEVREIVERLTAQDQAVAHQLSTLSEVLMDPSQMTYTLRRLLEQHPGVGIVSIENLPVQNLRAKPSGDVPSAAQEGDQPTEGAVPLYQHQVELVLVGSFDALYRYLFAAEQNAKAFFWDSVEIQVEEYPLNRMTLRVHTLSGEEGWLGG
jgi:MSHA biogenesis protein MshJ